MPALHEGALTSPHIAEVKKSPSLGLMLLASLYTTHVFYNDKLRKTSDTYVPATQVLTYILAYFILSHKLRSLTNTMKDSHFDKTKKKTLFLLYILLSLSLTACKQGGSVVSYTYIFLLGRLYDTICQ